MFNVENVKAVLIGLAIGDALGVPVEFSSRDKMKKNPAWNYELLSFFNKLNNLLLTNSKFCYIIQNKKIDIYVHRYGQA